jgi:hypothetical protein
MLSLGEEKAWKHPIVLTEFGRISLGKKQGAWGYSQADTADEWLRRARRRTSGGGGRHGRGARRCCGT